MEQEIIWALGLILSFGIFVMVMVVKLQQNKKLGKHYMMADLKLKRLREDSPTRKRLEAAQKMFAKGWEVIRVIADKSTGFHSLE